MTNITDLRHELDAVRARIAGPGGFNRPACSVILCIA